MKILQLNIWGGKLGKQIIELIGREKPDIVCFQEAIVLPHHGELLFTQYGVIQKETGFEHSYFSPAFGFTMMNYRADFGNAVMSRVPFTHTTTVFTRGDYNATMDLVDGDYNMRNLQHVTVEHGGKPLHILNHHGHHIRQHKNGDDETLRQCGIIADYIKTLEGDVVLTGDFNLAPESESIGKINAILTNHCIQSGATTTRTPLTHKTEVCDYIFSSPGLATKNFAVLPDIASDHAALVIEVG
jgi:endonuclease/exonuclease/phosphatase family metal-dependent hydrolase